MFCSLCLDWVPGVELGEWQAPSSLEGAGRDPRGSIPGESISPSARVPTIPPSLKAASQGPKLPHFEGPGSRREPLGGLYVKSVPKGKPKGDGEEA